MILIATIINLVLITIFILLIRRNILRVEKKKNGNKIIAEVNEWKVIIGQPTRYALQVKYDIKKEKQTKWLITSKKFAKKYEKEKIIPIVVIRDSSIIFLEEEDWRNQNLILLTLIILTLPSLFILLLCNFLEIIKYIKLYI